MDFVTHEFQPVFDENSRVLILGTFPSVKSREENFYYGHRQNRFWKVIAGLTGWEVPQTIEEKKRMLLANGIAVWDVIASCEIQGSSDSSIRNVTANDIAGLLKKSRELAGAASEQEAGPEDGRIAGITRIYANGDKAFQLYRKYCQESAGMEAIKLPSTSPANAAWSLEKLVAAWDDVMR